MSLRGILVALLLGVVQGISEWLPISSEGNLALVLTALDQGPTVAVQLSLFLHLGTALAATLYYRHTIIELLDSLGDWRLADPFGPRSAELSFLVLATVVSGVVGLGAYLVLLDLASSATGGMFIVAIGGLLILTGLIQRVADRAVLGDRRHPDLLDGLLVGVGQGIAILPGISRSGTTLSFLLFRGHPGDAAFTLSFLLSIPAAVGAAGLAVADVGGLPGIAPVPAGVALLTAAVVGYLTIDVLMRAVRRIAFWFVCVAIGALAVIGGLIVVL